jgi:hypothetical protein
MSAQRSEALRSAIRWLDERRTPVTSDLIEEASRRFDLSPLDEQFLLDHFLPRDGDAAGSREKD